MIVGTVEYLETGEIVGWALDRKFGDDQLLIEAFVGDRLIGMAAADLPLTDLPRADQQPESDGHGFRINLRQPLTAEATPDLVVYATALSGERALLASSPRSAEDDTPQRQAVTSPQAPVDDTQHPVFILGSPRSGTTAMAHALLLLPKYDGYHEGHLLPLLDELLAAIRGYYAQITEGRAAPALFIDPSINSALVERVPIAYFENMVLSSFIELPRSVFSKAHWVDKTPVPAMINTAPLLRMIWPNSRFIFMKRRGIENVVSCTKKFHQGRFRDHCAAWTDAMWAWTRVRARLAGAAIELDQLLLARDPRRAAVAIGAFLALSDSETADLEQAFSQERPEQTSDIFGSTYDPAELSWSPEEMKMFERACSSMMEEFGYDFGPRYYREGAEDRELVLV